MFRLFLKHFFKIFRLVLIIALVFQGLLFFLRINQFAVPTPNFLFNKLQETLAPYQLTFKAGKTSFYLNGTLDAGDVSIFYQNSEQPLATCERLCVKFSTLSFAFGKIKPVEASFKNATTYCSPAQSPTGLNEPVFKYIHALVAFKGKAYHLKQLSLSLNNLDLVVHGTWNQTPQGFLQNVDVRKYFRLCSTLLKQKEALSPFNEPAFFVYLSQDASTDPHLDASFFAQGFKNDRLSIGPHLVQLGLSLKDNQLVPEGPAYADIQNFDWKKTIRADHVFANADLPSFNNFTPSFKDAHLVFTGIPMKEIDFLEYNGSFEDWPSTQGSFAITKNRDWIEGKGNFNILARSASFSSRGEIDWDTILPFIPPKIEKHLFALYFNETPSWNADITLDDGLNFAKARFTISAKGAQFQHLSLDHLFAEVDVTPEKIDVTHAFLNSPHNYLEGSYFHNFATQDYRFLCKGSIDPYVLNPWMKPWWPKFWEEYELNDPMSHTNIDILGNWANHKNNIYAHLSGENFLFRGVPISRCSLRLNTNPLLIELQGLKAWSPEGQTHAHVQWNYDDLDVPKHYRTYFNWQSSLPLDQLTALLNNREADVLFRPFDCALPPNITLHGETFSSPQQQDRINIDFDTRSPLSYNKLPLDYLQFNANYNPFYTVIKDIQLGFAQGHADATASLLKLENSQRLAFEAHLRNANQNEAVNKIKALYKKDQDDHLHHQKNIGGLLDLDIDAVGTLGDVSGFTGEGRLDIKQAELGKIHLFGILSHILDVTPLALGTFKLTNLSSGFQIRKDIIRFPDLNIFGPTANMKAQGNYTISSQNLDFVMNVSPLGKMNIPVISHAFLLFSPLTRSFQVNLKGTLDDPIWDINVTPLGLFKKKPADSAQE